jgi:thiol-disulfide isomerase/thioredoxin
MAGRCLWRRRLRSSDRRRRHSDLARAMPLVLAAAVVAACAANSGPADSTNIVGVTMFSVNSRQAAPPLVGMTLGGGSLALSSIARGDIVVINVWASWCGPCRQESPMLATAAKTLSGGGVTFLGLDEQDPPVAAREFVASVGATYPDLVDESGSLLRELKLLPQMGVPSTLVLDKHGRMAARVVGPMTSTQLEQIVKSLQSES